LRSPPSLRRATLIGVYLHEPGAKESLSGGHLTYFRPLLLSGSSPCSPALSPFAFCCCSAGVVAASSGLDTLWLWFWRSLAPGRACLRLPSPTQLRPLKSAGSLPFSPSFLIPHRRCVLVTSLILSLNVTCFSSICSFVYAFHSFKAHEPHSLYKSEARQPQSNLIR
jgi:hypothetical protein